MTLTSDTPFALQFKDGLLTHFAYGTPYIKRRDDIIWVSIQIAPATLCEMSTSQPLQIDTHHSPLPEAPLCPGCERESMIRIARA